MTSKDSGTARNELDAIIREIERKIKSFKTLNQPQVDWKLYALLRRLGLTKYEILAYVALVEAEKPLTILQLIGKGSKTAIPQPRAYDVMGSLIKYGLVEEASGSGKPKLYRSVPPEVGLENLMDFFTFAKKAALDSLKKLERPKSPSHGRIWEVKEQTNIRNAIKRIASQAKHEILIVADFEVIKELWSSIKKLYEEKNILISLVLHKKPNYVNEILDWNEYAKIRFRSTVSMPYLIADRNYAIQWGIKTFTSNSNNVAQIIENQEFIATLIDHFFFTNWKTSEALPTDLNRKYPITTVHIQTAIDEINVILEKKGVAEVSIEGHSQAGEKVHIEGKVVHAEDNWNTGIFSITLDSNVTIGGMLARIEDIIAEKISIKHK
ncbi:MAG: TrmB family transcriptional regulator [Candidatus Hermodarchaeota archaeon]